MISSGTRSAVNKEITRSACFSAGLISYRLSVKGMEKAQRMAWRILWRAAATIITLAAFLVGSLIYIGFYAPHYSFGQDVIVVLVALIVALTAVAIIWLSWVGRRGWIPNRWMD